MASSKRISQTFTETVIPSVAHSRSEDVESWKTAWQTISARDLIDSRIVTIDATSTVEEACEKLLHEGILCLLVKNSADQTNQGLFDFSDVNAFLTLAATLRTLQAEDMSPQVAAIVSAAKAGRVEVQLVSNLSDKNLLHVLQHDATIIDLLALFCKGNHRVLIQSANTASEYLGMVSDRSLLAWFSDYASKTPSLQKYLSNPLNSFSLPSLNLFFSIVAADSDSTILDAMKLMSDEGVSSIAVLEESTGSILSAVSVIDVGKIVVPSQSNQILSTPLHQFVAQIKASDGSTDGVDKYPIYSVTSTGPLEYTIHKLLATNAHRLFITEESAGDVSPLASPAPSGGLSGIVSVVDILSIFARLADISDVDPTRMKRHRRASSTSSTHSSSSSRSSSRNQALSRHSSLRSGVDIPGGTRSNRNSLNMNLGSPPVF